ncbi:MAG TPA: excinuclease ABC subunit A, partial [Pirellulales bacterium]|nr:excinuclease ABC subunit A [Pirellulales bacterium]
MASRAIQLRGVEVHNLQKVDLDLPHRRLIVFCGLSGSGKSSLAFDTLYAEGQRRYIESFSAYTRQFLERLEKPAAQRIDGIPPAIAVASRGTSRSSRSTVGTATEANDYLRLLFAKIGRVWCQSCGREVRSDNPQSVADELAGLPSGTRYLVAFAVAAADARDPEALAASLRERGYVRVIWGSRLLSLDRDSLSAAVAAEAAAALYVVIDRLTAGGSSDRRLRDSLETAFTQGAGRLFVFVPEGLNEPSQRRGIPQPIDGELWRRMGFSNQRRCEDCQREYPAPEPRLFSFNSPLGACPECEGFGNVIDIDLDLVVPDPRKTIAEGAIAPWNTPAYRHELEELLELAPSYDIPVDVPFAELSDQHRAMISAGVPERKFGGLAGFFAWLQRKKYKMHIRVFLSRWRSYRTCPVCQGTRLKSESLATRIGGLNIAEVCRLKVWDALHYFQGLELTTEQRAIGGTMLEQVQARLRYLEAVGLGYLTLERTLRTLSGGEAQRVALTSALGSSLVNMLYVLDEPTAGLHPQDPDRLIRAIRGLRDRGNTVVVVEHEEAMIRAADQVVEIGPGAGQRGGHVVFQGTPADMTASSDSL